MNKPIIALDIDDVLSRTAQTILDYGNERWGHGHSLDDFTEHLAAMWQVDPEEANQRWIEFMASGHFESFEVIPEAKEVLRELNDTYRLIAVTSRRESLLPVTRSWLDTYYSGLIEEVYTSGIYGQHHSDAHLMTKAKILLEVKADFLIDDQPKHCLGAVAEGIQAILFGDYPWQRDISLPEEVSRCATWTDVKRYFDGN